jgi:hypothetical protein
MILSRPRNRNGSVKYVTRQAQNADGDADRSLRRVVRNHALCRPPAPRPVQEPDERFRIDIFVYTLETGSGDIDVAVTNGTSDQRMADPDHPHEWKRREDPVPPQMHGGPRPPPARHGVAAAVRRLLPR